MKNSYESDRLLSEYLLFHYGKSDEILPYGFGPVDALDFHKRSVELLLKHTKTDFIHASALDVGCAVGRAAFELSRHCPKVIGIDFSARFVQTANALKRDGAVEFIKIDEGKLGERIEAKVPDAIERKRVEFIHADACNLPQDLGAFDLILLNNLIDRLPNPRRCIESLPNLTNPGGTVMITSPYTWLIQYTSIDQWLGGNIRDGRMVRTFDSLRELLEPYFELVACQDLPLLIREHTRKFQWSVSQATIWRRFGQE
jgi:putative 4-mercaptohistidine N1-methyltranferase